MARTIDPETRERFLRLTRDEGVSVRAAARAANIPHTTAARIYAQSELPYSGGAQSPAVIPPPAWDSDQPRPPPAFEFVPGYNAHAFKSFIAPLTFDGFSLERVRNAISLHRQGIFLESSALAITIMGYGPVIAALGQRVAPALALPRLVRSGTRGLSRVLGAMVRDQLAPRAGLMPSQYFPPTLWGSMAIDLAQMGFAVLQHVYGDPDPVTGVRMVYTRRWPTWAVQYYRYRRTFVAITTDGPVDIINDGKFTLVADNEEPHFMGAIVALGEEAFDGVATKRARAQWIDRYGDPKLVGKMPANVGVRSPEGQAFFQALSTLRGPDGFGALPAGSSLEWSALSAQQSTAFETALASNWQYVAAILLGSDGTMTRGTGVYSAPIFAGVRRDLVDRDLKAMVRAVNQGHVAPWLDANFSASIAVAGGWVEPVLDIPLPDPDGDARQASIATRMKAVVDQVAAERTAGCVVTQERVNQIADSLGVDAPTLADMAATPVARLDLAPTDIARVVTVDEARRSRDLPPLGDERGAMMIAELDVTPVDPAATPPEPPAEPAPAPESTPGAAEASSDVTGGGGTSTGPAQPTTLP